MLSRSFFHLTEIPMAEFLRGNGVDLNEEYAYSGMFNLILTQKKVKKVFFIRFNTVLEEIFKDQTSHESGNGPNFNRMNVHSSPQTTNLMIKSSTNFLWLL